MSIVINTNLSSLVVRHSLSSATKNIGTSLERLSTGYRINRAADDSAGLTISQSFDAQSRGALAAQQNAQTGVNLLQTAEGDLGIIQENLQRIRDLTVQAANDTYGTSERNAIKSEVSQRLDEISRIAESSTFNKVQLLDGTYDGTSKKLYVQVGTMASASLNAIDLTGGGSSSVTNAFQSATSTSLGIDLTTNSTAFDNYSGASAYISKIDTAITTISGRRSSVGSMQNRLDSAVQSLNVKFQNMSASVSRIRDVDVALETALLTKNQILQQASAQLLAQANTASQVALSLINS